MFCVKKVAEPHFFTYYQWQQIQRIVPVVDSNLGLLPYFSGGHTFCTDSSPCSACQGDCDADSNCLGNLRCFQRTPGNSGGIPPGCETSNLYKDYDYCYDPNIPSLYTTPLYMPPNGESFCQSSTPCSACQGDCDKDDDCVGDLKCYQRDGTGNDYIAGCSPTLSASHIDYCYDPTDVSIPDRMQTGGWNSIIFVWPYLCSPGFTGPDGGLCSPCGPGTYKSAAGSAACIDCVSGTYSTATGATSIDTCVACPADASSPAGSADASSCH